MAGRPTKRSKKRDDAYFEAIRDGATVKDAAKISGYSYQAVMNYKRDDPDFAEKHNDAIDTRFDTYKEIAHDAAVNGFKERQVIKKNGKQTIIFTTKQSAAHIKFMLKAHEAGTFNYEKVIAGSERPSDDEPHLDLTKLSKDSLEELLNAAEASQDNEE